MDSNLEDGRLPSGAGLPMNGAAKASPPSVGIPDAAEAFILDEADRLNEIMHDYITARRTGTFGGRRITDTLAHRFAGEFRQRAESLYLIAPLLKDYLAQAMEARRVETGTGSIHDSAVGTADAPVSSRISDTEGR